MPTHGIADLHQREEMLRSLDEQIAPPQPGAIDHDTMVEVRRLLQAGWSAKIVAAKTGAPIKIVRKISLTK